MRPMTVPLFVTVVIIACAGARALWAEEPPAGAAGKKAAPPSLPRGARMLTADTDPAQLETFQATMSANLRLFSCRLSRDQRGPWDCLAVVEGPFVLTDLGGGGGVTVLRRRRRAARSATSTSRAGSSASPPTRPAR